MEKMEKFARFGLSNNMLHAIQKKGFEEPTPIQEQIIPRILNNKKDLVGQAQTGTGKTAAFGIPILENLVEQSKYVQVIVLVPPASWPSRYRKKFIHSRERKNWILYPSMVDNRLNFSSTNSSGEWRWLSAPPAGYSTIYAGGNWIFTR